MWIKSALPPRRALRSSCRPSARWRPFRERVANVHRALAAGQEQTCDDSEPDTTDAFMLAIAANSCDGTAVNATCAHTCISGYVNGSVTCSSAPAAEGEEATSFFEVVPCVGSSGACQVLHALLCPAARYSATLGGPLQSAGRTGPRWGRRSSLTRARTAEPEAEPEAGCDPATLPPGYTAENVEATTAAGLGVACQAGYEGAAEASCAEGVFSFAGCTG